MDKLVWCWGYDGSIMHVCRIYQTRFLKRWKIEKVRYFYTDNFTDVQAVAEDFIERYEQKFAETALQSQGEEEDNAIAN